MLLVHFKSIFSIGLLWKYNKRLSLFLTMTLWWIASSYTFLNCDITRSHCVASRVSNNGRLLISCHGFRSKLPKYNHPASVVFWCAFRGPPRFFSCLSSLIFINTTRVIAALMFVYTFFSLNLSCDIYCFALPKTKHLEAEHFSSSNGQRGDLSANRTYF